MILLDTNVISELIKTESDPTVEACIGGFSPETVFTAAIVEAEIRYGLARMPDGRRREDLSARVASFFDAGFQNQVLVFDRTCAAVYGRIRHMGEAPGRPIAIQDAMIAATALAYGAILATRNTRDFLDCGVKLLDPWSSD